MTALTTLDTDGERELIHWGLSTLIGVAAVGMVAGLVALAVGGPDLVVSVAFTSQYASLPLVGALVRRHRTGRWPTLRAMRFLVGAATTLLLLHALSIGRTHGEVPLGLQLLAGLPLMIGVTDGLADPAGVGVRGWLRFLLFAGGFVALDRLLVR